MLVLKCRYGYIEVENISINGSVERIIKCIKGYHLCPKPENQKEVNNDCFINVEVVKN